jgi:hypothetical protein
MCLTKQFTYYSQWKFRVGQSFTVNTLLPVFSRLNTRFMSFNQLTFVGIEWRQASFLSAFFSNKLDFTRIFSFNSQKK